MIMSWSDEDDSFETVKPKKPLRKPHKSFEREDEDDSGPQEEETDYKRKRAGKRSHRQKAPKDDFWEGDPRGGR
jgi:hypothetical protein